MSLKKEASGRRSIQVEVEVPGTPEQVWQAIATGPGISSWFVPTDVDGREGGIATSHFGPGMDAVEKITAWDAPHRFVADSNDMLPGAPTVATEWTVEAKSGGTCIVRVVHSLFAATDDWDDQLGGMETGWPVFFRILKLYLTHFAGQPCAAFQAIGMAPVRPTEAWDTLAGSLGLVGATAGERKAAPAGVPPFRGVVEGVREGNHPYALLMIDEPASGAAILSICGMGDQSYTSMSFYLYGEAAEAAAARHKTQWEAWMAGHFPAASSCS